MSEANTVTKEQQKKNIYIYKIPLGSQYFWKQEMELNIGLSNIVRICKRKSRVALRNVEDTKKFKASKYQICNGIKGYKEVSKWKYELIWNMGLFLYEAV